MVDLVYGPHETALAAAARAAGAQVVDGLEMLVRQGAASLRIWTGLEPPLETMRQAAARDQNEMATDEAPRIPATRSRPATEATAPQARAPTDADGTPGLTPPLGRGNSAMFLTDVIVELGYATPRARRRGDPGGAHRRPLARRAAARAAG